MTIGADVAVQGDFAEAWIRTLCTAGDLVPARPDSDRAGLDFVVHDHRQEFIRLQVKSTAVPTFRADGLHFELDIPTYDRLRVGSTPAYLVVLVLHASKPSWTHHGRKRSLVRASGFWLGLAGMPASSNTSSVTLILPGGNVVTPAALRTLFP